MKPYSIIVGVAIYSLKAKLSGRPSSTDEIHESTFSDKAIAFIVGVTAYSWDVKKQASDGYTVSASKPMDAYCRTIDESSS
uniref:Cystatin domain-containing protein n=1 Tax=Panagrellus redivivus TaxID=6233 RepID=A0A7E4V7X8_PANRE